MSYTNTIGMSYTASYNPNPEYYMPSGNAYLGSAGYPSTVYYTPQPATGWTGNVGITPITVPINNDPTYLKQWLELVQEKSNQRKMSAEEIDEIAEIVAKKLRKMAKEEEIASSSFDGTKRIVEL